MTEFEFNELQRRAAAKKLAGLRRLNPAATHKESLTVQAERNNSLYADREKDLHEFVNAEARRRGWINLTGSMATATHRTLGEPDHVLLADNGRVIFLELKRKGGKLRPEQAAMICHAAKLGHIIHVAYSSEQILAIFDCEQLNR